jgi:hypothetical protein
MKSVWLLSGAGVPRKEALFSDHVENSAAWIKASTRPDDESRTSTRTVEEQVLSPIAIVVEDEHLVVGTEQIVAANTVRRCRAIVAHGVDRIKSRLLR